MTPTYQYKIYFARVEFSHAGTSNTTPGLIFGPNGTNTTQTRGVFAAYLKWGLCSDSTRQVYHRMERRLSSYAPLPAASTESIYERGSGIGIELTKPQTPLPCGQHDRFAEAV